MKKSMLKSIAWILSVILCITIAQPLRVQAVKQEEITVMSNISEQIMEPYLAAFERKYPDITVKFYSYSDYEGEMKKKMESDTMGDVVFVPSFCPSDQYAQYFTDLGNYQELSEKYNYMADSKYVNDSVYGIPSSAYVAGILYNKEVFDKAGITDTPKTMDEFLQDLQMIMDRTDAIPFYTNYSSQWTLQYWEMFTYLEMTGNPDYRNNEFLYERNPFSQGSTHYQVYKLLYDIVSEGLCEENPQADDWEASKRMLNQGEIGCMVMGSWAIQQFKQAGEDGDSVAFMPFPNNVDGKQYMTISTDYCYAINAESEHQEAARAFIDYMLDESGYALDNQTLSLVKTDPYPDAYGDMSNVVLLNNNAATRINYERMQALYTNLNLGDNSQASRVIEAAEGYSEETFEEIIEDWNARWESGRPADMEDELLDSTSGQRFAGVLSEEYEVTLSETEVSFVRESGTVKVGYLKNLAPFQYEGENGFEGLARQLCDIISDTVGLTFEYVGFDSKAGLLEALQNDSVQMVAGLEMQEGASDTLRFSKRYIEYMQVVVKNDTTDVENLEEKCEARVVGDSETEEEQQGNCVNVDTFAEALAAVERGTADFLVGNYFSVDYYIKDLECEHVSVVPMSENGSMAFAFTTGADTRLISVCNKCLYAIPESRVQVCLMENLDPPAKEITLGRFIQANPILVGEIIFAVLLIIFLAIYMVLRQRWISEKKHSMEMKRYETLAALMDEYVFEYDIQTGQLRFDAKSRKQFGVQGDIAGAEYHGENPCVKVLLEEIKKAQEEEGEYNSNPIEIRMQDGCSEWYRFVIYTLKNEKNADTQMIGKIVNAQKEVEEQRQMLDRVRRDPLTGLYNREGFEQRYEQINVIEFFAYAVIDLDNFKSVNDELGHDGGDRALLLLAAAMQRVFDENTIFCRYGGDEFVLCVYDLPRDRVEQRMEQLVREMNCQMDYFGKTKHLSISMGAVFGTGKLPQETAFRAADEVLYRVKEQSKNNWRMEDVAEDLY